MGAQYTMPISEEEFDNTKQILQIRKRMHSLVKTSPTLKFRKQTTDRRERLLKTVFHD